MKDKKKLYKNNKHNILIIIDDGNYLSVITKYEIGFAFKGKAYERKK
jgi:hypothetical protein